MPLTLPDPPRPSITNVRRLIVTLDAIQETLQRHGAAAESSIMLSYQGVRVLAHPVSAKNNADTFEWEVEFV